MHTHTTTTTNTHITFYVMLRLDAAHVPCTFSVHTAFWVDIGFRRI